MSVSFPGGGPQAEVLPAPLPVGWFSDGEAAALPVQGLGARLRELREGQGWSLRELGQRSGVDHTYIKRLEGGGRRRPSPEVIRALAWALYTSEADLLVAGGYIAAQAAWQIQEAVDDVGYRVLLRRAERIHDPVLRQFVAAAIQTAIGMLGRPPPRRP